MLPDVMMRNPFRTPHMRDLFHAVLVLFDMQSLMMQLMPFLIITSTGCAGADFFSFPVLMPADSQMISGSLNNDNPVRILMNRS
jgi:hypothetical protein